jgi:hypothetical protein
MPLDLTYPLNLTIFRPHRAEKPRVLRFGA